MTPLTCKENHYEYSSCRSPNAGCYRAKASRAYRNGAVWRYLGAERAVAPRTQPDHPSALTAQGKTEQLPWHIAFGYQNGLSREEIVELFTHLAFYAGWPAAASALTCLNAQEASCP